mgnify:CR=1 FL=1
MEKEIVSGSFPSKKETNMAAKSFSTLEKNILKTKGLSDAQIDKLIKAGVRSKDDLLTANVTMTYRGDRPTFMIVLDLGIPPGFTVDTRPFETMVAEKRIDKF